jgi:hypothetical protein
VHDRLDCPQTHVFSRRGAKRVYAFLSATVQCMCTDSQLTLAFTHPWKMPPRKEPKETVTYPASKRKAPPFKPLKPSKVLRIPTTESESSKPKPALKRTSAKPNKAVRTTSLNSRQSRDDDEDDSDESAGATGERGSDSDDDLDNDPLAKKPQARGRSGSGIAGKQVEARDRSALSLSSVRSTTPRTENDNTVPPLAQLSEPTQLPQPLLLRLLHESFDNKATKIDKDAIIVLQKYMEVFVREAVARAAARKKEDVEAGTVDASEAEWLELEDLEKVAPGLMLDF